MNNPFLPTLCLMLLIASCAIDEGIIETEKKEATDLLSARIEDPSGDEGTKLSIKNGTTLVWDENDKISVVGTASTTFTLSSGGDTQNGTFLGNFSKAGEAPYFAVMPADNSAVVSGDAVSFSIPQQKAATTGNITKSANPIAGKISSNGTVEFKNLFGLLKLQITLKSGVSDIDIKKITLHDLGGNMLWGTCTIPIVADALAYDKMTISGGDNTISMVWNSYTKLTESEVKSIYFPVPPGALDNGFSVVFYEKDAITGGIGRAWTFIQKISSPVAAQRSKIVEISKTELYEKSEPLDVKARGYYKSLFVDAGYGLSQYYTTSHLPWIPALSMSADYEYFDGREISASKTKQTEILIESEADANGVLLYPDNSPRFRMVYVNGGSSDDHGKTLEIEGCERFHKFFHNGGSYVGTCAGSFMATTWYTTNAGGSTYSRYNNPDLTNHNHTFGIWPGTIRHTRMPVSTSDYRSIYTAMKAKCSFAGFSEGDTIELVRHHGGSFLNNHSKNKNIEGAEELFSYQYTEQVQTDASTTDGVSAAGHSFTVENLGTAIFGNTKVGNKGEYGPKVDSTSIWAYKKPDGTTGRAVLCGSHPESEKSGKKLNLMKGMVSYALEGTGNPKEKNLNIGQIVTMDTDTTKIGDRQYHHFTFNIPSGFGAMKISLKGINTAANLYLALRKGDYAWMSDADYVLCNSGNQKTLIIKNLKEGKWYLAVYCASTVTAVPTSESSDKIHYFQYQDKIGVLNGVPYKILIESAGSFVNHIDSFTGDNIGTASLSMDD